MLCLLATATRAGAQTTTSSTEESTTSTTDTTTSTTAEPTTSTAEPTTSTEESTTSTTDTTTSTTEEPTTSTAEPTTSSTEEPTTSSTSSTTSTTEEPTTTTEEPTTTTSSTEAPTTTLVTTTSTTAAPSTTSTSTTATTVGPTTSTTMMTSEVCNDGVDNDGDELLDCQDLDCVGNPACPTTCQRAPTFASIECRLAELSTNVETTPDIQAERARLIVRLTASRTAAQTARTACAASETKRARKALLQSARKLQQYRKRLRGGAAKRTIPAQLLTDLLEAGDALRSDVKTLRATVQCPTDAAG